MSEWWRRLLGKKSQEQINEEVTQELLAQDRAAKAYAGRPQGDPLIDEHPGYYIATAAAQPGGFAIRAMAPFAYRGIINGLQNGESAVEAFSPGFKFNSLQDLAALKKYDFAYSATPGAKTVKTTSGFKPYYIKDGNPNVLTDIQQEQRARDVVESQRSLRKHLKRMEDERGIITSNQDENAMMRAIEANPKANSAPPEGSNVVPYRTGYRNGEQIMFMDEPLMDWMEATDKQFGPHSNVVQLEKPLKAASNYWDRVGLVPMYNPRRRIKGFYASPQNMQMLSDGLENSAGILREMGMLKKQGGVLSAKSGIHIKKENRGKFTKSAKAAGHSVQEHAHAVMRNPNATPLQRKRANFAIQAAKWAKKRKKHRLGGKLVSEWALDIIGGENAI